MRLGLNIGYSGARFGDLKTTVRHAERLGYDSAWVAESYGSDAVTVLSHISAWTQRIKLGTSILQMPARTPANTAMTALTLDALSGGRLLLGLGVSGPQVVEGWHGVAYGKPLARTREYVEILRRAIAREAPLEYAGEVYRIPYDGPGATGLGVPLKSILHPVRTRIPIYLAAAGPRNMELTGEIADGWLPPFYSPDREDVLLGPLDTGLARRRPGGADGSGTTTDGSGADGFDIAATTQVFTGDDLGKCRDQVRPFLALYIGGMGARGRNFYFDLACRYGFEAEATAIQDAYLAGRRREAAAAVPDQLVDEVALVGDRARIADRLAVWAASRVGTLIVQTDDPHAMEVVASAL